MLAFWPALFFELGLGDLLALSLAAALGLAPALGEVGTVCEAVAAVVAGWLKRFMNPTTPTALSGVAPRSSWTACASHGPGAR